MLILANVLALALIAADEPKPAPAPTTTTTSKIEAREAWQLSLPEAIRIGLENSEVIRVISKGPDPAPGVKLADSPRIVIAKLNADASTWNFKAAVMAHVRSIEQQYWSLSAQQVTLWSREVAVKLGEEILRRQRDDLAKGKATKADVAEAEQQLENFKLNLISATSDLITTERQLRNILGLPASDNRRIAAITAAIETKVDPKWEESVATMLESQPDIAQQRQLVGTDELRVLIEGENPTLPAEKREACKVQLARQKEFLTQITHQSTHSLARFYLEIDANYKQYQTAMKLRAASQQRLEAQRAFYDEGRVTIDRLLDAVSQYANAVAQEAQFKSSYNTSIAALEETQGTLLTRDKITVADGPNPIGISLEGTHSEVVRAAFTPPPQTLPPVTPTAPVTSTTPVIPPPAKAQPASTTYKLKATFGVLKGLEVELEVCPSPK